MITVKIKVNVNIYSGVENWRAAYLDITKWVENTFPKSISTMHYLGSDEISFDFENEDDAILFKLTWS